MKKLFILFIILFSSIYGSTQVIPPDCWYPALPSHCETNKQILDDNTNINYAVYQASSNCVYLQWNFPLYDRYYLIGLKVRISGGGLNETVTIHDCPLPGDTYPFYPKGGIYTFYGTINDPGAVKVTFIYSEIDWLTCEYEGIKFIDYFGFNGPLCVPPGSFQNEDDDDFGGINISFKEKTTGLNPTVVRDYINITMEEEITSVKVIDINGSQVKQFDNTGFMRSRYDLSSLIPGMYIVRIVTSDDLIKNYKIVKE